MTRTPFDAFSKQLLEEFLSPFGTVELNREIAGESRFVDVWFSPSAPPDRSLGLLARIATTPCLIEPYRNAPGFQRSDRAYSSYFSFTLTNSAKLDAKMPRSQRIDFPTCGFCRPLLQRCLSTVLVPFNL